MTILYQLGHGKYKEIYIVNRTATFYHLPTTNNNNNRTILYQSEHGWSPEVAFNNWTSFTSIYLHS